MDTISTVTTFSHIGFCRKELMYKGGCLHCFHSVPCCSTFEYPYIHVALFATAACKALCVILTLLFVYLHVVVFIVEKDASCINTLSG